MHELRYSIHRSCRRVDLSPAISRFTVTYLYTQANMGTALCRKRIFMKSALALLLGLTLCLVVQSAKAQMASKLPSHCKPDEVAYLNALMASVRISNGRSELNKSGKVVSVCA